jgi:hypothetical protein
MKILSRSLFLAVLTVALVFSSISFAQEQGKVRIENGIIYFPEADIPTVNMKTDLKFSFSSDSPPEILAIQGKIFGGNAEKTSMGRGGGKTDERTVYIIPLSYDSVTKLVRLLYTTNNYGTRNLQPSKYIIGGIYGGSEGSDLKNVSSSNEQVPFIRFYVMEKEKQGYILRFRYSGGTTDGDFFPVAELPIPEKKQTSLIEPAPKKERGKIKIESGFICFPEDNAPDIKIKEDLKFSFSSDSPEEIRAIQGKIFGKKRAEGQKMMYLIPVGYDRATKEIRLMYINDNNGTQSKPIKMTVGGIYNGSEGSPLKNVNDKSGQPWAHFYVMPTGRV